MDDEVESVREKINRQIDIDKEVLSALPVNNKKNLKAYKDKVAEVKKEYEYYLEKVTQEMKRRVIKIESILPDPKIAKLEQEIQYMDKIKLLNKDITSFEKMELDEILFVLKRFYKNNLELVNDAIVRVLEKFRMVGIDLKGNDFNYSLYAKEYMTVFLEEAKLGNSNSPKVKETFEQIYWKCPDIIIHIEMNFRNLYLKNEKVIDKYFNTASKQIMKELGLNQEEAIAKYNSMNDKLIDMKNKDTALILEKFLKGKEVIKNYEEITIKKNYKKLLGVDQKEIEDDKLEEYNSNIFKMSNSLYEYKNYLKFKFIYDEILEINKSNEKFNTQCNGIRKQINKLETKLFKTNKRVESLANHKGLILKLFNKSNQNNNKLENINTDANERILELKELYRKYETNKIKSIIVTKLNDSSTIYDALVLVAPFYSFLVETIIKHFEDISQDNIRKTIEEFREFIKYPYITIINNIKISEEKDITIVIKDKYNLCDINVTKGDLDEDNIDNLILSVESICKYNYLRHSKIKLDDVNFVLQAKKILEV